MLLLLQSVYQHYWERTTLKAAEMCEASTICSGGLTHFFLFTSCFEAPVEPSSSEDEVHLKVRYDGERQPKVNIVLHGRSLHLDHQRYHKRHKRSERGLHHQLHT